MPKFIDVEAWIIVDEGENYVVAHDVETAAERYESEVGNDHSAARRTIKVTLKVPVPEVLELTAEVTGEPAAGTLTVAG